MSWICKPTRLVSRLGLHIFILEIWNMEFRVKVFILVRYSTFLSEFLVISPVWELEVRSLSRYGLLLITLLVLLPYSRSWYGTSYQIWIRLLRRRR
jgi:hypothetical protein